MGDMKRRVLKKVLMVLMVAAALRFIAFQGQLQDAIRIDITERIRWESDGSLRLPWYLEIPSRYEWKITGTDQEGNEYEKYIYDFWQIVDSTELNVIVRWENQEATVIAFLGESRGLDGIEREFPGLEWKRNQVIMPDS